MKAGLEHVRPRRRKQIERITEVFAHHDEVEMVILFGSYARGDYQDKRFEYESDFDFLVLVGDRRKKKQLEYDDDLDELLEDIPELDNAPPLNLLLHTVGEVNDRLAHRRYFFMDVARDGLLLYDSGRCRLRVPPQRLTPEERRTQALEYFDATMQQANEHFRVHAHCTNDNIPKLAAFHLHQTAETFFNCQRLVCDGYKPKSHNLKRMLKHAVLVDPAYAGLFPRDEPMARKCFKLLCKAYVEARYNPDYKISEAQLQWLAGRMQRMGELTQTVCEAFLAELDEGASRP